MTKPWGQIADKDMMMVDPADIPDTRSVEPLLIVRCPAGHTLVQVYGRPAQSTDTSEEPVAVWNGPVRFPDTPGTSAGYYIWHRRRHIGSIPQHAVGRNQSIGEPVLGVNIGGIITAQCRTGTYHMHTRDIERWLVSGRRDVKLPNAEHCQVR